MRRNITRVAVLLLLAATALPALAAGPGTGSIAGTVRDQVTGMPFPGGGANLVMIDAFNTATMFRGRAEAGPGGAYTIPNLEPGTYKVRFRYQSASGLSRYLWHGGTQSFDTADPVTVLAGASLALDISLPVTPGGAVSGTITEAGSGDPLGDPDPAVSCYFVQLYEASGIGTGQLSLADAAGAWATDGLAPAGQLTAVGGYSKWCGDEPPHLDQWYRGASGWPFEPDNLVADARTFATAELFTVADGVAVTGIDFELMVAPTCRGQAPTMFGTTLNDTIDGTAYRDVIVGLAGHDRISGLAGNDLLCGNAGRDTLNGNAGNDTLAGGAGSDRLTGGPGTDKAVGGGGTDTCDAETVVGCP